ncbi:hypothetical protein BJ165DRAFT_282103 [Panaeolus papilionaceus]|nr:hypothetical protein BJ165DRAFT_282103 [Panaeolus papilionaceus]
MLLHTSAYGPETNFADLVLVDFPNLNTPTLGMLTKRIGLSWISKTYIQQYQHTLTSLQLLTHMWTNTQLKRVFSGLGSILRLKRLAIATNRLSPTLLKLVAVTCPTLEELVFNIRFGISSDPSDGKPDIAAPFSRDPPEVTEVLRSWNLHSIALIPLSPLMEISAELRALIVSVLPCVRSFSDVRPDSYATAQRDPGVALRGRKDFWGSGFDLARMDAAVAMHSNYLN